MKNYFGTLVIFLIFSTQVYAQEISKSFELRYFKNDTSANGITDFHGETEVFNTEQRIAFLHQYGKIASAFFNDAELNKKVVSSEEKQTFLKQFKPQPKPGIRKTVDTETWKWAAGNENEQKEKSVQLAQWETENGVQIINGQLLFNKNNISIEDSIPLQKWRFSFQWDFISYKKQPFTFSLSNGQEVALNVGVNKNGEIYYSSGENIIISIPYKTGQTAHYKVEVDLINNAYNFFIDNNLVADFVPLTSKEIVQINHLSFLGSRELALDNILGISYKPQNVKSSPYTMQTFINENFEPDLQTKGWMLPEYDDTAWNETTLPKVHGGERFAGESLYLRKKVSIGEYRRAVLNVETIDPGGEIYINGNMVEVVRNRHPVQLDITNYLIQNAENIIAFRVNPNIVSVRMGHAPSDLNVGWFLGRVNLELTNETFINEVLVNANSVNNPALMRNKIEIVNEKIKDFSGSVHIKYYPWFPDESETAVVDTVIPVKIRATSRISLDQIIQLKNPELWTPNNPFLYKIIATLTDENQVPLDDYVITTGVRTIGQEGGTFRLNGQPAMLNGAQIMGYRMPVDKLAKWNLCPPDSVLAEEIMMIKNMNGNLLRVHIHSEMYKPNGVNDPRIAEMCDQLGIMSIWQTPAWIRTGGWWNVDFEGYPKYMKQVYNHPSIVMWEVTNHPWAASPYTVQQSNAFYKKVFETVYPVDQSRLISPASHNIVFSFENDKGTIDDKGNTVQAVPEYTAHQVTRGNQDSFTGYGKKWDVIRKIPSDFHKNFLDSPDRAYFNFEHEESTSQPNWSLMKGKPWYQIPSYEWDYDKGSIGRRLQYDEWLESQAWQAFSAWESMKKQRMADYDGFSWCNLHGGPNMGTYRKPIIDCLGHAKLAFYANKMIFQKVVAGSNNVDVVYGPSDKIQPVIMNLGEEKKVNIEIRLNDLENNVIDKITQTDVYLPSGRTFTQLPAFKPDIKNEGYFIIEYIISKY